MKNENDSKSDEFWRRCSHRQHGKCLRRWFKTYCAKTLRRSINKSNRMCFTRDYSNKDFSVVHVHSPWFYVLARWAAAVKWIRERWWKRRKENKSIRCFGRIMKLKGKRKVLKFVFPDVFFLRHSRFPFAFLQLTFYLILSSQMIVLTARVVDDVFHCCFCVFCVGCCRCSCSS